MFQEQLESLRNYLDRFCFDTPVFASDTIVFGVLLTILALIFWAHKQQRVPLAFWIGLAVLGGLVGVGFGIPWWRGTDGTTTESFSFVVLSRYYLVPLLAIGLLISFPPLYRAVPMLLLCYFTPSLLTAFGWVDPESSNLYYVATRYLLPACLVLLTLSIDLQEIFKLGPKALIMFLTGTVGVVLGGPIAILIFSVVSPETVRGEPGVEVWRGMTTVAGSWIGGGANQTAMKEIFLPESNPNAGPEYSVKAGQLFSVMVAIDVLVAEFWMMFLLFGVGKHEAIDRFFKADASSVQRLQAKMEAFSQSKARIPTTTDLMTLLGIAFGVTALCHLLSDAIAPWIAATAPMLKTFSLDSSFFWLIILSTTFGLMLSFTPVRDLEGVGASKIGTVFIFILVATIGLTMHIFAILEYPGLFAVGLVWMAIHVGLLFLVGYLIRAPYFFLAVGSKANIGGAASAPVVAAAFHPSLAPVGVLLAVLGYALGTYGAWLCGLLMQYVAPSAG